MLLPRLLHWTLTEGCYPAQMLLIGGQNPLLEEDGFEGRVEALWAARPDVDVAWRVGDAASLL